MVVDPGWLYWQPQTVNNCVEESTRIVTTELGHTWTELQIDRWAAKQGWYDPALGTAAPPGGWVRMLHHFGAPHATQGARSLATVRKDLGHGRKVIVVVDGERIWSKIFPGHVAPDTGTADHAVVVDAIGPSTVTLTDTGNPVSGAVETVSIAVFKSAWKTSGYDTVEAWG